MTAAASGTTVWAWMSTVLTRLPLTTTSRRLPCPAPGPGVPEALDRLHPTNARPANAPAINSAEIGISVLLDQLSRPSLLRLGLTSRALVARRRMRWLVIYMRILFGASGSARDNRRDYAQGGSDMA